MTNLEFSRNFRNVQKPGRYCGGELNSVVKNKAEVALRFAFCFPDEYGIGMSHLGMKILYSLLNSQPDIWCERVFAPWTDMEEVLRHRNLPLFALESGDPVRDFDIVGFTLQYELCYTTVLNMLDLSGIPLRAADRKSLSPLVIAGGPCVCNPEPMADFFDLMVIGEGEEVLLEVAELYKKHKNLSSSKREFLLEACQIEGVYVPEFYSTSYNPDGTISAFKSQEGEVAEVNIKKRIVADVDKAFYPDKFVVPYIEAVHDRVTQEIFRGCIRGCRFCQAGFIYRPVREKSADTAAGQAKALYETTGYDEISLTSLSTSDYSQLDLLLDHLLSWTVDEKVNLALPSLRIDNFSSELLEKIKTVRQSSLTFAPEAGTQRLRDIINKNITEEEIIDTCKTAFGGGYINVKLYFMMGLPFETDDDILGIAELAEKILSTFHQVENRPKGKSVNITISVATFVPKPHTPFQWCAQDIKEEITRKQKLLLNSVKSRKIKVNWHDAATSLLEAVFSRGDRRLADVLELAHKKGCKLDSWSEFFDFDMWVSVFEELGIDMGYYANRHREVDEMLPWDFVRHGVSKKFLQRELERAKRGITTGNCRDKCGNCGAQTFEGIGTVCPCLTGGACK